MQPKYNIYPSVVDAYQNFLDSDDIHEKYWGNSENPPHTVEEFREIQFKAVIDAINRVPFDNEAVSKGTAFNEVIDCIIENRTSDKMSIIRSDDKTQIIVSYKDYIFQFPVDLCVALARRYQGSITQYLVEGDLETNYGIVHLYGYTDELLEDRVVDIKTTSSYSMGKFRKHFQHLVYPYCLRQMGNNISRFDYDIVEMPKYGSMALYSETYCFEPERDIPILKARIEDFIAFLEDNRHLIFNSKIFNYRYEQVA